MATHPKRMSRKELKQQDEVMTSLQRVYEWLRRYRLHLIVGALALVAALLAASGISGWMESSQRDVAVAFDEAYAPVVATVAPNPAEEPLDAPPEALAEAADDTFATEEERTAAAVQRLDAFLSEHDGSPLADEASLGLAAVRFQQGQYDKAASLWAQFLDERDDSPIAPFVAEELGLAAAQQKKFDEASKWFGRLIESSSPYFKALGHLHLGDLANPKVPSDAPKDKAKAKAAYEQGLAALRGGERRVAAPEQWLEDSLERKLALLDVAN